MMGICPWLNSLCMTIFEVLVSQIWHKFVGMASAERFRQKFQTKYIASVLSHLKWPQLSDKILGLLVKPSSASVMEREGRTPSPSWCWDKHPLPMYIGCGEKQSWVHHSSSQQTPKVLTAA